AVVGHLAHADGVMVGRKVMDDPWFLAQLDRHVYGVPQAQIPAAADVLAQYTQFADHMHGLYGTRYTVLARPLYAFFAGHRGRALRGQLGTAISRATTSRSANGPRTYAIPFGVVVQEAMRSVELDSCDQADPPSDSAVLGCAAG
ncbi:hypothetical protein H4R19_007319, partial [Coemansia spiralis]